MFLEIPGFLSSSDCDVVCAGFDLVSHKARQHDYTGHAVIDWHLMQAQPSLAHASEAIVKRVLAEVQFYGPLRVETVVLTAIGPGGFHPLHADNSKLDLGRWIPNHTPKRAYSTIVYLNDDFDGGEIVFPLQSKCIKPTRGLLLGFPSGSEFPHEVLAVTRGCRYTMPIWFSRDPSINL